MFKKLNEELEKYVINELSDETLSSYYTKVRDKAKQANARLEKAKKIIKKSNVRKISGLPQDADKETAKKVLEDLKYEMKKIDSGSDWRLEENDGYMSLEVRYWGEWEGDDGSGDYDWQTLSPNYRAKLDSILTDIQKKYGVQINEPGSEKNWLDFEIKIKEDDIAKIKAGNYTGKDLPNIVLENIDKFTVNDLVEILDNYNYYNKCNGYRLYPSGFHYWDEEAPVAVYPAKLAEALLKCSASEKVCDLYNIFYRCHGDLYTWGKAAEVWREELEKNPISREFDYVDDSDDMYGYFNNVLKRYEAKWPKYINTIRHALVVNLPEPDEEE